MWFNKKNIRSFTRGYLDMAFPVLFDLYYRDRTKVAMLVDFLLLLKEFSMFAITFAVAVSIAVDMLSIKWVADLPALVWILIPIVASFVVLPAVQSPLKFLRLIWEKLIPDGDEKIPEKRKGIMRLTNDGELEEVFGVQNTFISLDEIDRFERIKTLANQKRQ